MTDTEKIADLEARVAKLEKMLLGQPDDYYMMRYSGEETEKLLDKVNSVYKVV